MARSIQLCLRSVPEDWLKTGSARLISDTTTSMGFPSRAVATGVASGLLLVCAVPALAQSTSTACPFLSDQAVAAVLGTVQTTVQAGAAPGVDFCDFIDGSGVDYSVTHEIGAFKPGDATGPGMLVAKHFPDLSATAVQQLSEMNEPGTSLVIPGYDITIVSGIGDAAVWVQADSDPANIEDGLLVEHGPDVFVFGVPDGPDAQTKLNNLAQTTLSGS